MLTQYPFYINKTLMYFQNKEKQLLKFFTFKTCTGQGRRARKIIIRRGRDYNYYFRIKISLRATGKSNSCSKRQVECGRTFNFTDSSTVMSVNKRYHGFGDNIHIIKVYVEVLFGHYDFLITHWAPTESRRQYSSAPGGHGHALFIKQLFEDSL